MWDTQAPDELPAIEWPGPTGTCVLGDETSRFVKLPSRMCAAKRWVMHRRKRPYDPQTGLPASVSNDAHWGTFEHALTTLLSGKYDGIGFVLGPDGTGNYWQGIDLDHVVANCLQGLASKLDGYVEYSPSGEGVHAIGYGTPFPAAFKHGGIEAYSERRFFTVTGNAIRCSL